MSQDDRRFDHNKMHTLIGLDWVWAAFVVHAVTPPEKLAREIDRLLKENGSVAILDWRPDAVTEAGSVEQVTKYLQDGGLKSITQTWQDDDTYLLEAR